MKRLLSLLSTAVLLAPPAAAQASLLDPKVRDVLHEELSGELAKEDVIAITRHHRIQGSRDYRDAAHHVLKRLRAHGYDAEHAWIESYPSDGKIEYQTWPSPSGWDIDAGELRMLEPYDERIVGYPEIAMSVVTYSNPGDVTAELVWVGAGTSAADYEGKDVAGKFVLATGYGGSVHRLAVLEHGAAAVVCYLDDERAAEYPDMLAYTGMWPQPHELEDTTFGFNLTNRQGTKLRRLLEAGEKVVLRGRVEGIGLEPHFMDVVVARIPGSKHPEEEIVFTAHLDHPKESANDNASGSAAILDVARGLRKLIGEGRLPQPERTLRFLWVPEWYGTMAYVDAHPELRGPELGGKVLANLNLDMVGENLELLHCRLEITRTPDSIPSALNTVVADMAAMVDRMDVRTPRGGLSAFNYRITPYSGGSDHMMLLDRKVPAVMFSHAPDYTHHTSEDTPDKVDPVELERCEIIAAGAAWYLANLTPEQAIELAWLVAADASKRVNEAARQAMQTPRPDAIRLVLLSVRREREALESVLRFQPDSRVADVIRVPSDLLSEHASRFLGEPVLGLLPEGEDRAADERIPVRTTRGPLAFDLPERALPPERRAWYESADFPLSADQRFEIVNFVDGENTVGHVRDWVAAEYGPVPTEAVARYLDDLVAVGALNWKE